MLHRQKNKFGTNKTAGEKPSAFAIGRNKFVFKWLSFIALCLILGGMLSFCIILACAEAIDGQKINYIYTVGMIPLMCIVAVPVTFAVAQQIGKRLNTLIQGMDEVTKGNLNTYIPTAHAKDFATVYENFNKMVSEIQSVEVLRTDVVDVFSHELKTPLASINGFARLLSEKDLNEGTRQKYLRIIINESERLSRLTKNILLLTKLDAQEIVSDKKPYNLTKQLQECAIRLENNWAEKNIDLTADLADADFSGDANLMESLWVNLIGNAVKFTPKNGKIQLKLTKDESTLTFSITDSGVGMTENELRRIFDKHYQSDKSFSPNGNGLGLTIVRRIVHLCGGTVAATSVSGIGSTFTVTLPR